MFPVSLMKVRLLTVFFSFQPAAMPPSILPERTDIPLHTYTMLYKLYPPTHHCMHPSNHPSVHSCTHDSFNPSPTSIHPSHPSIHPRKPPPQGIRVILVVWVTMGTSWKGLLQT